MGSKSDWAGTMFHCSDALKKIWTLKHEVKSNFQLTELQLDLHKFLK